jgi:hypothetical protein
VAMNFAPLDYPCQGASSESKKNYLDFFISEKIAKKKSIFLVPTAKNGFNGRNAKTDFGFGIDSPCFKT